MRLSLIHISALAEAPIGQMIDDTGLVISSYADGTISEEKLKTSGQIALKLAHKNTSHAGTILKDSDLALLTHK